MVMECAKSPSRAWCGRVRCPPAPGRRPVTAAFSSSPEGAEFIRSAAAGWAGAAVADGDPPGPAQQAAARTAAFYTTPPEAAGS